MGAFNSNNLRIECKNLTKEMEKQFYECYKINCDEYGVLNGKLEKKDLDNIYAIISIAFGDTILYYEECKGHSVSDWYAGYKVSYNCNNSGKIRTKSYDYCYGENTANGINCWNLLKEEIENKAKKKNINIDWCKDNSDIYPNYDNEEFSSLAEEILQHHGGLEGLSTIEKNTSIKTIKVDSDKIKDIITKAKSSNFNKLVEILESKLDSKGNYPDFVFKSIKKEKQESATIDTNSINNIIERINNNQKIDFKKLDEKFKDNKELVIKFIESNPNLVGKNIIKNASDRLKDDEDVVSLAVINHATGFQYASNRLKNDKNFVKETIKKIDSYLKNKYKDVQNLDPEFIKYTENLIILNILKNVSEELKNDKEILLSAISITPEAIKEAGKELKNNRDFILEAIKIDSFVLYYVSSKFQNDKELVLEAVKQKSYVLVTASNKLKNDKEVVLEAVKQNGYALSYASEELKNDREVVMEAIKNDSGAIDYASEELQKELRK